MMSHNIKIVLAYIFVCLEIIKSVVRATCRIYEPRSQEIKAIFSNLMEVGGPSFGFLVSGVDLNIESVIIL